MDRLGRGYIVYGDDVESMVFDWGTLEFLSTPEVTGAELFSFGIVVLAPGKGHYSHSHPGAEEIIYVMSGEGEQMVDEHPPVQVRPGASIFVPADVDHSAINTGWEPMRLLVIYSPAGAERDLRDLPECQVLLPGAVPR